MATARNTEAWQFPESPKKGDKRKKMEDDSSVSEAAHSLPGEFSEKIKVECKETKEETFHEIALPTKDKAKETSTSDTFKSEYDTVTFITREPFSEHNMIIFPVQRKAVFDTMNKLDKTLLEYGGLYYDVDDESHRYEASVCRSTNFCTLWIQPFTHTGKVGTSENYLYVQRSSGCHYTARMVYNKLYQRLFNIDASEAAQSSSSPLSFPSLTRDQKRAHFRDMKNVVFWQVTYTSSCASAKMDTWSGAVGLEKVVEEGLISLVDLCSEPEFCEILLQESDEILKIVIDIAIKHSLTARYYCCVVLGKLLGLDFDVDSENEHATEEEERQLKQRNAEVLVNYLRLSSQTDALIDTLVNECAVGKYYEVHTRVAASKLLHGLSRMASSIVWSKCEAMKKLTDNLKNVEIAMQGCRKVNEVKQLGDYLPYFEDVRCSFRAFLSNDVLG